MHRTFLLPLKPLDNAPLMELAQALQSNQRLTDFIFLHADRALLRAFAVIQTILLCCRKRDHAYWQGGRLCRWATAVWLSFILRLGLRG